MSGWKEVTHDEFHKVMGPQDVSPSIVTRFPYTSEWVTPQRRVIGKTVDYLPEGSGLIETRYLLPDVAA